VRQFRLQSGGRYQSDHLVTHVYTVPWWFPSIGKDYPTAFVSSLIPPAEIAGVLRELQTHVLSLYPTNLRSILPHLDAEAKRRLYLVVVHSEISTRAERDAWAAELGCPVLDEYSSEELTRIALELPCGDYHVCEDAVHLEVLDEGSWQPVAEGELGVVVGTNLLNEATPLIRYAQGDCASLQPSREPGACGGINWTRMGAIQGRMNDSFVRADGGVVPAGTLLDATYRWMYDSGVRVDSFELLQVARDEVDVTVWTARPLEPEARRKLTDTTVANLRGLLDSDCRVRLTATVGTRPAGKKFRPIRRLV
jgi:phenylacetate-CoA ligase